MTDHQVPGLILNRQAARIPITSRQVWWPNGIDIRHSNVDVDEAVGHLRVVNGITGEAVLIPITPQAVKQLITSLGELVAPAPAAEDNSNGEN